MTTAQKTSIIAGFLAGGITAGAFFVHAASLYSQTPSDPQKPIGYFFIALYSGFIGALAFGSAFTGFLIPTVRQNRTKMLGFFILSLSLAIVTALLIIFSPK